MRLINITGGTNSDNLEIIEPGDIVALNDDRIVCVKETSKGKIFYERDSPARARETCSSDVRDIRYLIDIREMSFGSPVHEAICNPDMPYRATNIWLSSMLCIGPAPGIGECVILFPNENDDQVWNYEDLGEPVLREVAEYPNYPNGETPHVIEHDKTLVRLVGVSDEDDIGNVVDFSKSAVIRIHTVDDGYLRSLNNPATEDDLETEKELEEEE